MNDLQVNDLLYKPGYYNQDWFDDEDIFKLTKIEQDNFWIAPHKEDIEVFVNQKGLRWVVFKKRIVEEYPLDEMLYINIKDIKFNFKAIDKFMRAYKIYLYGQSFQIVDFKKNPFKGQRAKPKNGIFQIDWKYVIRDEQGKKYQIYHYGNSVWSFPISIPPEVTRVPKTPNSMQINQLKLFKEQ